MTTIKEQAMRNLKRTDRAAYKAERREEWGGGLHTMKTRIFAPARNLLGWLSSLAWVAAVVALVAAALGAAPWSYPVMLLGVGLGLGVVGGLCGVLAGRESAAMYRYRGY